MPNIAKQIIGGIISGIVILIWAFAFFSVAAELKKASPSPETTEAIEDIEDAVSLSIKWYHITGGIFLVIGIIGGVVWILKQFGIDLTGSIRL